MDVLGMCVDGSRAHRLILIRARVIKSQSEAASFPHVQHSGVPLGDGTGQVQRPIPTGRVHWA